MTAVDPEGRIRHPLDVFHSTLTPTGANVPAGMVPVADGLGQVDYMSVAAAFGLGWFNVRDYGALGNGTTDDTTAIKDTIAAAVAAGGGVIYFPAGIYLVAGALLDTGAFNGQILLPDVSHSGDHIVLVFKGALRPGFHPVYGDTTPLAAGFSVIQSSLSGASGTAAVFSGGNNLAAPSSGGGNNLEVYIDDLVCLGPNNPTFTFWNLSACQGGGIGALQISTPGAFAGSPTQPTNTNSYGIKLPAKYFSNATPIDTLSVGGFYTQVKAGELGRVKGSIIVGPGIVGMEVPSIFYPTTIHGFQATSVAYPIRASGGTSYLDIESYVAEHSTSPSWAVTVYDLDDTNNYITGEIVYLNAVTGGTIDHTFTKNGGTNVVVRELGTVSRGQHILLADGHATPFTFNDLLQMDDGSDFMWNDG